MLEDVENDDGGVCWVAEPLTRELVLVLAGLFATSLALAVASFRFCRSRLRRPQLAGGERYHFSRKVPFWAREHSRQRAVSFRLIEDASLNPSFRDGSHGPRAYGDELLVDPGLRSQLYRLRQQSLAFIERRKRGIRRKISGAKGTLQLLPGRGDGLESLFASAAAAAGAGLEEPHPSSTMPRAASTLGFGAAEGGGRGLSEDGRLAFDALTRLDVFGAAQMPALVDLCRGATVVERREGEAVLQGGGTLIDLLVLKSGSCEAFVTDSGLNASDSGGGGQADQGSPPLMRVSGTGVAQALTQGAHTAPPTVAGTRGLMTMNQPGTLLMGLLDILALLVEAAPTAHVGVRCLTDCCVIHVPRRGDLFRLVAASALSGGGGASANCDAELSTVLRALMARANRATLITGFLHLGLIHELRPVAGEGGGTFSGSLSGGSLGVGMGVGSISSTSVNGTEEEHPQQQQQQQQQLRMQAIRKLVSEALGLCDSSHLPRIELPAGYGERAGGSRKSLAAANNVKATGATSGSSSEASQRDDSHWRAAREEAFRSPEHQRSSPQGTEFSAPLQLVHLRAGQGVFGPEEPPCVYVVLRGFLRATVSLERLGLFGEDGLAPAEYARHGAGAVVGQLSLLTGSTQDWYGRSGGNNTPMLMVTAADAGHDGADDNTTVVVRITRAAHDAILRSNPEVAAAVARRLVASTPPLLRSFDFGVGYVSLPPGGLLVQQGQYFGTCLYVVLHGRLRATVDVKGNVSSSSQSVGGPSGGASNAGNNSGSAGSGGGSISGGAATLPKPLLEVFAEYGRGVFIGESEAITREPSWATVQAVRHSSLARLHGSVLSWVASRHPSIIAYLAAHASAKRNSTLELLANGPENAAQGGRPKTITIMPISGSVPLDLFAGTLKTALENTGSSAKVLTSSLVASKLGLSVFEAYDGGDDDYFEGREDGSEPDNDVSDINNNHSNGGGGGSSGGGGGGLLSLAVGGWLAQQEERFDVVIYVCDWFTSSWNQLCAAQADRVLLVCNAGDSSQLSSLEKDVDLARTAPSAQVNLVLLHVDPPPGHTPRGTKAWVTCRSNISQHFHVRLHSRDLPYDTDHHRSDFQRLARCLTGKAIGLVLGGGGARGMAHMGVLRALEQEGLPVDLVCGTSQGAFIGALYAHTDSYLDILPRCHAFARRMGSVWNYVRDLTLPTTAYFTGLGFNHEVSKALGAHTKIEDLWLPYFCVSTDLTTSQGRSHRNGTLWRYVRASMSLAGYLPPLCEKDPTTGRVHYLLDGGYVNNLPADLMKAGMGAGLVIAVDVGAEWTFAFDSFGASLNGFWVFLRRLQPWGGEKPKIPSMADISEQLAYISSVKQLEEARARYVDLYLRPPVAQYATLDFQKYATIELAGYEYARPLLRQFKRQVGSCGSGLSFAPSSLRRTRSVDAGPSDGENM